ncbi:hypothetical protein CNMCM5878_002848 [Aspergillus fumigatiaffinis]|nr:hypothetical protein CNMCM5878_002848 [Aspergillus fumigatiaffinis]
MPLDKDTARTARLRENKRRYRERQRLYTLDLEQKLRQLQQKGVEATVEVQIAARRVAEENQHLRTLLNQLGASNEAISGWLKQRTENPMSPNASGHQQQLNSGVLVASEVRTEEKPYPQWEGHGSGKRESGTNNSNNEGNENRRQCQPLMATEMVSPDDIPEGESYASGKDKSPAASKTVSASSNNCSLINPTREKERLKCSPSRQAQVKHTRERPPQQRSSAPYEPDPGNTQDGVPCSVAYSLLRQHATSEEKIDALARVLEEGCVPDRDGGCRVKHKMVAQALVDVCL